MILKYIYIHTDFYHIGILKILVIAYSFIVCCIIISVCSRVRECNECYAYVRFSKMIHIEYWWYNNNEYNNDSNKKWISLLNKEPLSVAESCF